MATSSNKPTRLGCVSFLNARPLIHGLDDHPQLDVRYKVPSALLDDLVDNRTDLALCPVIDFQLSPIPLQILPVGGIGSDGTTLTVSLYSTVPIHEITRVQLDTDSHTSIILSRIVLHDEYGIHPEFVMPGADPDSPPEAMLLIGDKVVTGAPDPTTYPFSVDVGHAWKTLTGLPFVFAIWMSQRDANLGDAPQILDRQRDLNLTRIDEVVRTHAPEAGWPKDLAAKYLGRWLKYPVGATELTAVQRFWRRAHELGFIERLRPIELHPATPDHLAVQA
ncbi:MAG: menaquinone biosynthetic enzyme MqnA/MqnD family protein [Planctomycetota bacterium]|jgi:chorismate dehydratase